jgi:omega-amidase
MNDIKITLIQSELYWEDIDRNLENFSQKIQKIEDNPDIILLPEMFNTGFTMNPEKCAEEENGKSLQWLKNAAKEKNCSIVCSLIIKEATQYPIPNTRYFNRLIWMNSDGSYSKYDKRHLFRLGKETKYYTPGKEILITELKGWKFRPLICYDLRFPVWSMNRLIDREESVSSFQPPASSFYSYDYDCLIYISNWPKSRSYAWKQLLIARGIENQSYAIGLNRIGNDGNGVQHSGNSLAVDYKGNIIYEFKPDMEEIQTVILSYDEMAEYRKKFAFGLDWDKFSIQY